jgi:hypothetical protein
MLRNQMTCAVLLAAVLAAGAARATVIFTNTATANYNNEAAVAQPPVLGTVGFTGQSNPVLAVVKTGDKASGPSGTVVTWQVRVSYPRVADVPLVCGDDSKAQSVVITDPIPAGFTYNANSVDVSTDDGGTWTPVADGASGLGFTVAFGALTLTVNTPDLVEGQGDTVNCGASPQALAFRFKATK